MATQRGRLRAAYDARQAAYDAQATDEAAGRAAEPAEPPEWQDEAIDRHARALSRAGYVGGWNQRQGDNS